MNSRGAARPEVGATAWNWRFPKILACGLSNGTCVLWDLSKDKPRPVVSLRHPAGCGSPALRRPEASRNTTSGLQHQRPKAPWSCAITRCAVQKCQLSAVPAYLAMISASHSCRVAHHELVRSPKYTVCDAQAAEGERAAVEPPGPVAPDGRL